MVLKERLPFIFFKTMNCDIGKTGKSNSDLKCVLLVMKFTAMPPMWHEMGEQLKNIFDVKASSECLQHTAGEI
jgi:hypothetical protein